MTAVGTPILATEYNAIQTQVQTVLGTYYGQSVSSSPISTPVTNQNATRITAAQWQALYTDLLTCYNHQNSTNGTLTYATTSSTIKYSDYASYAAMGNSILSNYLQFNSGYSSTGSFTSQSYGPGWGLNTGSETLRHQITLTFPSNAAANYFFNTGGTIYFSAGLTGGSATTPGTKDFSWASMLSHMGTIAFTASTTYTVAGATTPGSTYGQGFNNLPAFNTQLYQKLTEAPTYSPNQYDIYAGYNSSLAALTFYIEFEDRSGDATIYTIDEPVGGTVQSNVSYKYASGGPTGFTINVNSYLPTATTNSMGTVQPYSP